MYVKGRRVKVGNAGTSRHLCNDEGAVPRGPLRGGTPLPYNAGFTATTPSNLGSASRRGRAAQHRPGRHSEAPASGRGARRRLRPDPAADRADGRARHRGVVARLVSRARCWSSRRSPASWPAWWRCSCCTGSSGQREAATLALQSARRAPPTSWTPRWTRSSRSTTDQRIVLYNAAAETGLRLAARCGPRAIGRHAPSGAVPRQASRARRAVRRDRHDGAQDGREERAGRAPRQRRGIPDRSVDLAASRGGAAALHRHPARHQRAHRGAVASRAERGAAARASSIRRWTRSSPSTSRSTSCFFNQAAEAMFGCARARGDRRAARLVPARAFPRRARRARARLRRGRHGAAPDGRAAYRHGAAPQRRGVPRSMRRSRSSTASAASSTR